ncbi:MAG: MBL fold metallo-hydrolase [Anaerolineae bacterium]
MIHIKFWGTRGSITTPGPDTQLYGGNTPCVEVVGFNDPTPGAAIRSTQTRLFLDAGSGLAPLQSWLMAGNCGRGKGELNFLISDYHWDHIIGLPFFAPMFVPGNRVKFHGESVARLQASIERLFVSNYSPHNGVKNVAARLSYHPLALDAPPATVAGFQVVATENAHTGKSVSYRLTYGQHTVMYSTDHQAGDPAVDARLVALARGVDLWILSAQYTPAERLTHSNWGHSSHLEAVALALEAGVKTVVLFHHDPDHNDHQLDEMHREAIAAAGNGLRVLMARDGMVVELGR